MAYEFGVSPALREAVIAQHWNRARRRREEEAENRAVDEMSNRELSVQRAANREADALMRRVEISEFIDPRILDVAGYVLGIFLAACMIHIFDDARYA
jgi:hypothetical protein